MSYLPVFAVLERLDFSVELELVEGSFVLMFWPNALLVDEISVTSFGAVLELDWLGGGWLLPGGGVADL